MGGALSQAAAAQPAPPVTPASVAAPSETASSPPRATALPRPAAPPPPAPEAAKPAPLPIDLQSLEPPTAPPPRVEPETEVVVDVPAAGAGRQLLAELVDFAVVVAVVVGVSAGLAVLSGSPWPQQTLPLDWLAWFVHSFFGPSLLGLGVGILAGVAHGVLGARFGGRTLGRWLTGSVLVRASGAPPTWAVASVRGVASVVSAVLCGAGFFWSIVDRQHRSWHDLLAGTVVVRRHV